MTTGTIVQFARCSTQFQAAGQIINQVYQQIVYASMRVHARHGPATIASTKRHYGINVFGRQPGPTHV